MDPVSIVSRLWQRKLALVAAVAVAILAAAFTSYRFSVSPPGLHKRSLQVGAASSQILVDSPKSTLVAGATLPTFDALATRAKIYGEYLSSLEARARISALTGIPAANISSAGPYSPESGQVNYTPQPSESRAGELLQNGALDRLLFTAQDGVPIISVDAQAPTSAQAVKLADASFTTLQEYVHGLAKESGDASPGVTVRELGTPEGGTIGGSNNIILMTLAFLAVLGLGCAVILAAPRLAERWRALALEKKKAEGAADSSEEDPLPDRPVLGPQPHRLSEPDYGVSPLTGGERRGPVAQGAAHSR